MIRKVLKVYFSSFILGGVTRLRLLNNKHSFLHFSKKASRLQDRYYLFCCSLYACYKRCNVCYINQIYIKHKQVGVQAIITHNNTYVLQN